MHHLTCGISSLLHSVNLILFTLLLAHLIHPTYITSSQSSPSFSPSVTPSSFHSRLKTHLYSSLSQIFSSIVFLVPFWLFHRFWPLAGHDTIVCLFLFLLLFGYLCHIVSFLVRMLSSLYCIMSYQCKVIYLTLWRPLLPYGYSYEASCVRPG